MNIDDFLKPKKVRCITGDNRKDLTNGKIYDVIGAAYGRLKIHSDNGGNSWYDMDCFELVIESAENPLQGVELTPEFEAVAPVLADNSINIQDIGTNILDTNADIKDTPNFKVGDPVYFPRLSNKLCVIGEGQEDDYVDEINGSKALAEMQSDLDFVYDQKTKSWLWDEKDCAPQLLYATPENHALLSKLYPHIEFERPPTQEDIDNEAVDKLAQAMKNKLAKKREQGYHGWETCKHGDLVQLLINHVDKGDLIDVANFCAFLFARGEKLTEAVLDE